MFDFLQNLTKSAREKRQEAVSAYLDSALTPAESQRFERQLAQDPGLQAELEQQRRQQQTLRQLPRRSVPRNFTLDPARYGRPQPQPLFQLYPVLRVATALTAVLFVVAIVLELLTPAAGAPSFSAAVDEAGEAPSIASEVQVEGESVEETEIVAPEAVTVEEEAAEQALEEPAPEAEMLALGEDEATVTALARTADATASAATVTESLPFGPSPMATAVPDFADTANGALEPAGGASVATAVATEAPPAEVTGETDVIAIRTEPLSAWRWLQIGLGAALVLLALITYLSRR